jgi:hypothetical protein
MEAMGSGTRLKLNRGLPNILNNPHNLHYSARFHGALERISLYNLYAFNWSDKDNSSRFEKIEKRDFV